jgi:hypothetical protein
LGLVFHVLFFGVRGAGSEVLALLVFKVEIGEVVVEIFLSGIEGGKPSGGLSSGLLERGRVGTVPGRLRIVGASSRGPGLERFGLVGCTIPDQVAPGRLAVSSRLRPEELARTSPFRRTRFAILP